MVALAAPLLAVASCLSWDRFTPTMLADYRQIRTPGTPSQTSYFLNLQQASGSVTPMMLRATQRVRSARTGCIPEGAGLSCCGHTGDAQTAEDSYQFLVEFFRRYPALSSSPFWLAGESYAGHYIPQLAEAILAGNQAASASGGPVINFKGVMLGNRKCGTQPPYVARRYCFEPVCVQLGRLRTLTTWALSRTGMTRG